MVHLIAMTWEKLRLLWQAGNLLCFVCVHVCTRERAPAVFLADNRWIDGFFFALTFLCVFPVAFVSLRHV